MVQIDINKKVCLIWEMDEVMDLETIKKNSEIIDKISKLFNTKRAGRPKKKS